MHAAAAPVLKDIVLIGAGHAHALVLRDFGMRPQAGVRLTVVTRQVHTPYSGMLPGLVAGHYAFDDVHIDTAPLAGFAGARLYQSEAIGIDLDQRLVICADRPPVRYDLLSVDIGSTPGGRDVTGAADHAIPVKPIDRFLERFEAARERVVRTAGPVRVAIVGGGAAGVELALALETRLRRERVSAGHDPASLAVTIVSGADTILPALATGMRSRVARHLDARGIVVRAGARVTAVAPGRLTLANGGVVEADEVFWTTEATAAPWLAETALSLDSRGFIAVDETLRSISHDTVFAAGDCATMIGRRFPKSGVYAVRQGPVLVGNLRKAIAGRPLDRYRPQREALYLLSTGDRYAVGARNGVAFEGLWVWRWKDRIDRAFMAKFSRLPEMPTPAAPDFEVGDLAAVAEAGRAAAMRCGGCGAKVGAGALSDTLADIDPFPRPEVVAGLGAPDDAALIDRGDGTLDVSTVDYLPAIIDDPYVFGRIAANHALGDIFAMGATPATALAIATLSRGLAVKSQADLADMLAGANEVLAEAECALVGGHTSEGSELALGFAVTGRVARERVARKGGLMAGDALILTKALGTGTLMAAHARRRAKARWVMAALDAMQVSSGGAANILIEHGSRAMTDVTGFGLLGHLGEMLAASHADVRLSLASLPVLDGALDTLAAGIVSSLQSANLEARRHVRNAAAVDGDPRFALLFDPQTAGGLLAAVPGDRVAACIEALEQAGYGQARVIGRVDKRGSVPETVVVEA
jgi:selenide,water dikinase